MCRIRPAKNGVVSEESSKDEDKMCLQCCRHPTPSAMIRPGKSLLFTYTANGTHDLICVHDSLKTMCYGEERHVLAQLLPERVLDDGIRLIVDSRRRC